MNFRVVAHSPRPPPGKQVNVPQPGFSPLYIRNSITYLVYIYMFMYINILSVAAFSVVFSLGSRVSKR